MSRVLVVLHIYYHDLADYFIDKLKNITDCEWSLVVTWSTSHEATKEKLLAFKPDTKFVLVDNSGYDVWPFIQVIRSTDFSQYDYVLKLHTKGCSEIKIKGVMLEKDLWRNLLVDAVLKNKSRFRACLKIFDDNKDVGCICSYELHMGLGGMLPEDEELLKREAQRISLDISDGTFCAGTMFMARIDTLQRLKEINFSPDVWGNRNESHISGTLAHVYERILGIMVTDAGYRMVRMITRTRISGKMYSKRLMKRIFDIDRDPETYRKYMVFMGYKFMLENHPKKR